MLDFGKSGLIMLWTAAAREMGEHFIDNAENWDWKIQPTYVINASVSIQPIISLYDEVPSIILNI